MVGMKFCFLKRLLLGLGLGVSLGLVACATPKNTVDDLIWYDCQDERFVAWFEDEVPSNLECTWVNVPMQYNGHTADDKQANASNKTVQIAMTRLAPKSPKGSLLFISGGPGQHSLSDAGYLKDSKSPYSQALLKNFIIYGFAQRGVSPSSPEIVCNKEMDIDGKTFVEACLANTDQDFLKTISSETVVQDLENIRTQLGVDKISMVGWSYGTKLVARYAELYGDHLHAGVLDGVVDTTEDMFTMLAGQERGYDRIMERYFADCVNRTQCPFGAKNHKENFWRTISEIGDKGLIDKEGREITSDSVLLLFYEQLMWSDYWTLADGLMTDLMADKTELYDTLSYDFGDRLGMFEDLVAINCADSNIKLGREDYIRRMRELDDLSDYDNYKPKTDDDYLDACYYWQDIALGTDILTPPKPKDGTPKLLFIAQTGDPATPYQNAVNMAKFFDGFLLTIDGDGHTLTFSESSECVDKYAIEYLLNPANGTDGQCTP